MTATHKQRLYIGLDMGGTDIKGTVIREDGEILVPVFDKVLTLASEGPRRALEQLRQAALKAMELAGSDWDQVEAVGLDTPGPASLDGVLGRSPNLRHPEWEDFPIRKGLEDLIGKPTVYANDGNAAGVWEYFRVFGDDPTKILGAAILGTGLGGALVQGGVVLVGARGYGAEFGHIRIPTHELVELGGEIPVCGCGQAGCAEAFVSLAALDKQLRRALERPENRGHSLHQIPDQGRDRAYRLLGLAQRGDWLALELFDRQAQALGLLFVQLANCFDPHLLLIGGGLSESSQEFRDRFIGRVREVFRAGAFPLQAREVEIEFAGDQDNAGCRGAALLARQWGIRARR